MVALTLLKVPSATSALMCSVSDCAKAARSAMAGWRRTGVQGGDWIDGQLGSASALQVASAYHDSRTVSDLTIFSNRVFSSISVMMTATYECQRCQVSSSARSRRPTPSLSN